jgi:hypothetical protein
MYIRFSSETRRIRRTRKREDLRDMSVAEHLQTTPH